MKKSILTAALLSLLIPACGGKSTADSTVKQPTVTMIKGSAQRFKNGKVSQLQKGDQLTTGEVIRTAAASMVDIDLGAQGVMRIKPASSFKIVKFEKNLVECDLQKGKLLTCLKKL
ncbi:MAG TPA: hypothetical protein VKS21_11005, partial [Spirochaetota bacterium]|nr:hypothetical protein [Spirochaetota bacterium]